ncbi:unnamed protein product, partial [Polarella glacialis]
MYDTAFSASCSSAGQARRQLGRPAPLLTGLREPSGSGQPDSPSRIIVRNTFIDICPADEGTDFSGDDSPTRRNTSAPASPTRWVTNVWADDDAPCQLIRQDSRERLTAAGGGAHVLLGGCSRGMPGSVE